MGSRPRLTALRWVAVVLAAAPAGAATAPSPARQLAEQARADYRAGDHFAALAAAHRALARDPGDPAALSLNAQLVRDAAGPVPALPPFEQALKAAPGDTEVIGDYAATLAEAGRGADALRALRQLGERDPANRRARFLQALLAARSGHDDEARRLLWQMGDDPAPAANLLSGIIELRSGSARGAVERFAALARRQPDNPTVHLLLGRALLASGDANEVVARFAPLAERGDASPYLLTLVGRAYEQLGDRARAARYLDRAQRPPAGGAWALPAAVGDAQNPLSPAAAVATLRELAGQGKPQAGPALAARLAARYPGSADVARIAGDAALLAGEPAPALAAYRRAATVRSDFALTARMAAAARQSGRANEALALLDRRARDNPLERLSAVALAQAHAERAEWPQAAAWLERANPPGGADPRLLGALAQARLMHGDAAGALAAASQAHRLQRANGAIAHVLAGALAAQGRSREAAVLAAAAGELAGLPQSAGR